MIEKRWNIITMFVRPSLLEYNNVVSVIDWSFSVTANGRTSTTYGSTQLGEPVNNFINIETLTESQVIEWIKSAMGSDNVNNLDIRVTNEAINLGTPELSPIELPWKTN